ncbi:hypothetical protein Y032_0021g326 [Ancylostoma ceylanicum]|uniref:Uncharacterized protein n=1 Tax=Ancylostoma ceylanicum TaxID=53326 RepID=A0A016UZP1_9BILA|nr:hypothetical protein Y032_0021g326 [Ancylostoma ceylanicum]
MDDYRTELMNGMKITQELIREKNDECRSKMKEQYDRRHKVKTEKLLKIGEKVFMRMPAEKSKCKHPKLAYDWSAPYRVIETSENSALISEIGSEEEPLRVQMDLLRKIPEYIDNKPIKTKTRRKTVMVAQVQEKLKKVHFRPHPKQFAKTEDTTHPLHIKFRCHEKAIAKPPNELALYKFCIACPFLMEKDANKLGNVLKGLPASMKLVPFENVLSLAQLVNIWLQDGHLEKEQLLEMTKRGQDFCAEALAVAILYMKDKCLHFQISIENLDSEDVYHEPVKVTTWKKELSGMYQQALSLIQGRK